ncbi:MAG: DUF3410 domain-containing protein [Chitinivibrionales bacterium]|nr:DUF3410 domain-containing protein [Chitinivibrionales bacterium]
MKVLADENIPFVKEAFADFGFVRTVPGREITRGLVENSGILLVRSITRVDQELLEASTVRFVATATIGTDHVDENYLRQNSIGFASAPGCNADSVAEYVLSALFHLAQKNNYALQSMTLGIVGVGNVGSRVLKRAQALGISCLLCDPPKRRLSGSDIYLSLDDVLAQSDIVTVHVPLIMNGPEATYHMIDAGFIDKMKQGAVLINTSRGSVADEQSMRAGVSKLGALVLDVWENEPAISLQTMKLADIATPHIAGYSFEGKMKGAGMIYQAACSYFFKDASWSSTQALEGEQRKVIFAEDKHDPVSAAVMQAYPVMNDDTELRKIAQIDTFEQGAYFDSLRKNYPVRREFTNFDVHTGKESNPIKRKQLEALGFSVVE